jgi:hypothetical protein
VEEPGAGVGEEVVEDGDVEEVIVGVEVVVVEEVEEVVEVFADVAEVADGLVVVVAEVVAPLKGVANVTPCWNASRIVVTPDGCPGYELGAIDLLVKLTVRRPKSSMSSAQV